MHTLLTIYVSCNIGLLTLYEMVEGGGVLLSPLIPLFSERQSWYFLCSQYNLPLDGILVHSLTFSAKPLSTSCSLEGSVHISHYPLLLTPSHLHPTYSFPIWCCISMSVCLGICFISMMLYACVHVLQSNADVVPDTTQMCGTTNNTILVCSCQD